MAVEVRMLFEQQLSRIQLQWQHSSTEMQRRLEQVCRVGVIAVPMHHDSNSNSNSKVVTIEKNIDN